MKRHTFDVLMSIAGALLTVALVVAGVLAYWGYSFADSSVREQLAAQKIYFPEKGSDALKDPAIGPYIGRYAGQQLVSGEQAKAFADHYIAVHLQAVAGGKTYSEVNALARAKPTDATLQGQVQTLFRGEALRGMLLNAYAFWKMGQLALIASISALGAAAIMLILTVLGVWHARRVPETQELMASKVQAPSPA